MDEENTYAPDQGYGVKESDVPDHRLPAHDSGLTTSDAVRDTYYNLPVIKAAHWRWLIITYFFLGGLAGGGFTIATLADRFGNDPAIGRIGRYVSFAALIPSPVLLILDLGRPERFLNMLRIIKLRSPMSLGSWALTGLGIFSGAAATLQLAADLFDRDFLVGPRRLVGILGIPFSIFLSGYTGILLVATNVPLWARFFPFMNPAFMSSAFSTSLAAISGTLGLVGGEKERTERRLATAETICLQAEVSFLMLGLLKVGKLGHPLTHPPLGLIFWPFTVGLGMIMPLILQLTGPLQGKRSSRTRRTLTSALVLAGGFSLRALMIFAGRKSANEPEYYFEMTKKR